MHSLDLMSSNSVVAEANGVACGCCRRFLEALRSANVSKQTAAMYKVMIVGDKFISSGNGISKGLTNLRSDRP